MCPACIVGFAIVAFGTTAPLFSVPARADTYEFKQQGDLATVRMVVGEPIRFFVVGREEAKLDMSNLKLTVRRLKPYPAKELTLDREGNTFEITEPLDTKQATQLEVKTELKGKSETLQFNIENPRR